ncbi:hypothetical protein Hanom_Chr05g00389621 [Helianthus anomalus]
MKSGFVCCILLLILGFIFSSTDASRDSQWMVSLPEIHFQDSVQMKTTMNCENRENFLISRELGPKKFCANIDENIINTSIKKVCRVVSFDCR